MEGRLDSETSPEWVGISEMQSWGGRAVVGLCTDSVPRLQDGSGYIDENELDALLKDLYEKNKKVSG